MEIRLAAWGLLLLLGFNGCCSGNEGAVSRDFSFLTDSILQEGDLVFRRGQGLASRAVLAADNYSVYSHTGVVVRDETEWKVVHIVPGEPEFSGDRDRIKMEPLDVFFKPKRALKGAVMRVDNPEVAAFAAQRAVGLFDSGILFDHNYNLNDTTRMYCTELIQKIFLREGLDLTGGQRSRIKIPGFRGDYILPSDIQNSPHVRLIYEF